MKESDLSIKEWLSRKGLEFLIDNQLIPRAQQPIRELTLGKKRTVFEQMFATIEARPECVHQLSAVGRAPAEIRAAFCGGPVRQLIETRNKLAHPKEEPAPNWTNTRSRLLEALRPLVVPPAAGRVPIASPVVRLIEERTDSTGWTRCEFETELGETIIASSSVLFFDPGNFYLVARNGPAVVRPILIPINSND
jgi:hypothetical protein